MNESEHIGSVQGYQYSSVYELMEAVAQEAKDAMRAQQREQSIMLKPVIVKRQGK